MSSSFSNQPGSNSKTNNDDGLQDAMESLKFARQQFRKVERDLLQQKGQIAAAENDNPSSFRKTDYATSRLHEDLESTKQQLRVSATHSSNASKRMNAQLQSLQEELITMGDEVERLHTAVNVMEQSVSTARQEKMSLEMQHAEVLGERDEVLNALHQLMMRSRKDVQQLRFDIEKQDSELARLNEQNSFLRLQCVQRQL